MAEIISEYEVVFASRTGVTILMRRLAVFDGGIETPARFCVSPDNPRDVLITAAEKSAVLKDLRKDYLDEAIQRGVIMFYELKDDEVVRCTPCSYAS
ncbi:MAG: hypothetical protein H3C49_05745 [Alphaproteobacteria bacterium]|nr:hypothetical protein [Alphaproteobacteria bacterium]HRI77820.1 hypothetical protein [Alphaproteobacteria bacterium]